MQWVNGKEWGFVILYVTQYIDPFGGDLAGGVAIVAIVTAYCLVGISHGPSLEANSKAFGSNRFRAMALPVAGLSWYSWVYLLALGGHEHLHGIGPGCHDAHLPALKVFRHCGLFEVQAIRDVPLRAASGVLVIAHGDGGFHRLPPRSGISSTKNSVLGERG